MSEITPITREEKLWNGEDLEPLTREEMYIKRIFDKTQTIPDKPLTRKEILMEKAGEGGGGDVTIKQLSVTANGTYSEEGTAYSPVNVAVPLPENAYLLKTASGSLVSFDDGTDLPMPSFICNIDAVQDLHGQDAPWVGGAGKNLLPMTVESIKAANTSGTWSNNNYTWNNVIYSILTDNMGNVVGIKVNGTATDTTYLNIDFSNVLPVGNYYANGGANGGSNSTFDVYFWNPTTNTRIKKWDGTTNSESLYNTTDDTQIQVPNTTDQLRYIIRIRKDYNANNLYFYPMIRLATEQDATFAPYSNICPILGHTGVDAVISPTTEASAGTTIAVSWQTEAGEVFGGYVDLVSGVLTVVRWIKTFKWGDASLSETFTNVERRLIFLPSSNYNVYPPTEDVPQICDKAPYEANWFNDWLHFYCNGNQIVMFMPIGTPSTEQISVSGELATPITYQLTPTQIKSLLGNNNAWCSTGNVDIDYFAKEV